MRKPVVVAAVILILTLSITLARRLAQPAIADSTTAEVAEVAAVQTSIQAPVVLADPIRPRFSQASSPVQVAETRPAKAVLRFVKPSVRPLKTSSTQPVMEQKRVADHGPYNAMLGTPGAAFRGVKDHGSHGMGTPQWIESLSGPKARIPVRDFAEEASNKADNLSEPLSVSVDSQGGAHGDSRVDSAH